MENREFNQNLNNSSFSTSPTTNVNPAEENLTKKEFKARAKIDAEQLKKLEKINKESMSQYSYKGRRNNFMIVLLVILLVSVIAGFGIYFGVSKLKNNSFLYVFGETNCDFIVDGEETDKFRTPPEIKGNRVLEFNLDLKINASGEFRIRFVAEVYKNNELLENTFINRPNLEMFKYGENGYCDSINTVSGNQTINLCKGVMIDREYEDSLNINNFKLVINVYLERV